MRERFRGERFGERVEEIRKEIRNRLASDGRRQAVTKRDEENDFEGRRKELQKQRER